MRHEEAEPKHETEAGNDGRAYDTFYRAGGGEPRGGEEEHQLVVELVKVFGAPVT
jgi:hypothetical protein